MQVGFIKYEERRFSKKKKKKPKKEDKWLGQLVFVKANSSGSRGDSGSGILLEIDALSAFHYHIVEKPLLLFPCRLSVWDQYANILLFYFYQCK